MPNVTAESLFTTFFLPLYPPDAKENLALARATDVNPGKNPALYAHLNDAAEVFAARAPTLFGPRSNAEANADANAGADFALDFSDASIRRLSAAITAERRDGWAKSAPAGSPSNELFNVVVHGAAYVGACIVRNHGGTFSVRRPLWESMVRLVSRAGDGELAVFHWWLKSLAGAGVAGDDPAAGPTLADRYRMHVELPCATPEALPILAPTERKLPRLTRPRYDTFYKYIKAHLPELRDVGRDFPSPERFDAFGLKWLEFVLLGGGRMLLVHGPGEHGVSLFWLSVSGFEKSAFYPADSFPEHKVTTDADTVTLLFSREAKVVSHQMLWWGP